MTGRIAAMSLEGTPISQADLDRIADEERLHAERQRQAVRVVAAAASDADDARMLLEMLGLDRETVAASRKQMPARSAA